MLNIDILVGSTLGGTEYVAEATHSFIKKAGFTQQTHFIPDIGALDLAASQPVWLICLSTHGAGDYPDNFKSFVQQIEKYEGSLSHLYFGIIGLGDSNYDSFCAAAHRFDLLLSSKGAKRKGHVFTIDVVDHPIPEDCVDDWIQQWLKDLNA